MNRKDPDVFPGIRVFFIGRTVGYSQTTGPIFR